MKQFNLFLSDKRTQIPIINSSTLDNLNLKRIENQILGCHKKMHRCERAVLISDVVFKIWSGLILFGSIYNVSVIFLTQNDNLEALAIFFNVQLSGPISTIVAFFLSSYMVCFNPTEEKYKSSRMAVSYENLIIDIERIRDDPDLTNEKKRYMIDNRIKDMNVANL